MKKETIAAIATGMTDSGIGIVRISGDDAIAIGEKVFRSKTGKKLSAQKSHTIHYGLIFDEDKMIDDVLVSIMKAPKSYTGDDTIEINCHGGMYVTRRILEIVLKNGARLAEPGEFTKRSFLNGKMDLSKSEAVMDLIHSKNEFALNNSLSQLHGSLYHLIRKMREGIIYEIAFIESALDDPEHISLDGYPERLDEKISSILNKVDQLKKTFKNGRIRKDGIQTVIVGRPNAGKSSLLNILTGYDRAIVTDIEGTTRDALEESVRLDEITLNLVDTAGIREASGEVEKIGVSKAKEYAKDADLILYVVDSSLALNENDDDIINIICDKNVIVLLNKSDLFTMTSKEKIIERWKKNTKALYPTVMTICANKKENNMEEWMPQLKEEIRKIFFSENMKFNDEIVITNLRHLQELEACEESLLMVRKSIQSGMPEDFYTIDLNNAYTHLGNIIGEEVSDDLMNEIFSKFCLGK